MRAPAARSAAPGLGLAISRELASLLGGEIHLRSAPASAVTFTTLPPASLRRRDSDPEAGHDTSQRCRRWPLARPERTVERVPGRSTRNRTGRVPRLLVVDDDPHYAAVSCGGHGAANTAFKVLIAPRGR
jgi:signal transduction histidine kinase